MRAIVLWEPWASLMSLGLKKVETRGWSTNYRGDLAICAAKREPDWRWIEEIAKPNGWIAEDDFDGRDWFHPGCVLCVVELFTCFATGHREMLREERMLDAEIGEMEESFGDYGYGRFGWRTRNLRPLKRPVPVVGRQGLFNLPPDTERIVREQL